MTEQLEQTSVVIAEEGKPVINIPNHLYMCMELLDQGSNKAPNIKCFYSVDGSVNIGVMLIETADSFLVGAPVRLTMTEEKRIIAESVTSEPVVRIFKTGLSRMSNTLPRGLYTYYKFLLEVGVKILPDYLTDDYKTLMTAHIQKFEFEDTGHSMLSEEPKIPGASEFAFMAYTKNKNIH